jgi:tRNA threonylcarbamoyladenosine biosynthesis protein TsaE
VSSVQISFDVVNLADEAATVALAGRLAPALQFPLVVYLRGDLGAGKTTFARALIQAMGFEGRVKSPSYGLLETYSVPAADVLHLDLYRIEHPEELEYLAIRDYLQARALLLVEWPERGTGGLPAPDLELEFGETDGKRWMAASAPSDSGNTVRKKWDLNR